MASGLSFKVLSLVRFKLFFKSLKGVFLLSLLVMVFFSCVPEKGDHEKITVFCASSLGPVMEALIKEWGKSHEEKVIINLASSGALARQIEHGPGADIFLSANRQWAEYLQKNILIRKRPVKLAGNRLVLIASSEVQSDSSSSLDKTLQLVIAQGQKVAIGDPGHVPLGIYTKEALTALGLYEELKTHLIIAKDARSALRLVEWGEAPYGIVYATDARSSQKIRELTMIPSDLHDPIEYDGLLINDRNVMAKRFLDFLASAKAKNIWKSMGFDFPHEPLP